jgi:hypothetical protein
MWNFISQVCESIYLPNTVLILIGTCTLHGISLDFSEDISIPNRF